MGGVGDAIGDAWDDVQDFYSDAWDVTRRDNWIRRFGRYLDESFISGPSLPDADTEAPPGPAGLSDQIARSAAENELRQRGLTGRRGTFLTGPLGAQGRYPLTRPTGKGY